MEEDNHRQLLVKMTEETHRKLRLQAADLNISLNELVVELIEKEYDRVDIVLPKKRITSSAVDEVPAGKSLSQSMRLMREAASE
ncbi:MAG: toxin-antitoxin system HicB family antitoxin [Syntrophobacteraceae bacterium]